jgi:hypothetical protein
VDLGDRLIAIGIAPAATELAIAFVAKQSREFCRPSITKALVTSAAAGQLR